MKTSTVQRCFADFEGRAPACSEIAFLDNFIRSREALPSAHSTTSVSTNDSEIAETLRDMMAKYSRLYPDYFSPCTFEKAFLLGSEVTLSGRSQSFSMAEHKIFSSESDILAKLDATLNGFAPKACKDGICVAQNEYLPARKNALRYSKRYAVTIVYSSEENSLLSFAEKIALSKSAISSFASTGDKLFCKVCDHSKSLSVNTDLLPTPAQEGLFDNGFGDYAIVVFSKPKKAKRIISLAKKHDLEVCSAIEVSKKNKFIITSQGKEIAYFKPVILRGAMGAMAKDIKIPDQKPISVLPSLEKLCEMSESNEQVYKSDVVLNSESAFSESIAAIISPLVAAVYDGLNTQNSEFSISINAFLSKNDDATYASLIGIYRAITELGIAVENPHLSMTEGQSSLSVALRVHSFKEKTPFTASISQNDMLKKLTESALLPDFETLRALVNGKNA